METDLFTAFTLWLKSFHNADELPSDNGEIRALLADARFGAGCCRCMRCASPNGYRTVNHEWRCRDCGYVMAVTVATPMEDSHLGLGYWLRGFWEMLHSENGVSALRFQQKYDLPSYGTVWRMLHKIRECFGGSQRSQIAADAGPSTACNQILGRHNPGNAAFVAVDLTRMDLEVSVAATAEQALAELALPPQDAHATAHMLVQSFRTMICGTHHGVSARYLPLYARAFFGRFSSWLATEVCERFLGMATRRRFRARWPSEDELALYG